MKVEKAPIQFSPIINAYLSGEEHMKAFYAFVPDENGLKAAMEARSFSESHRKVLVEGLNAQYELVETSDATAANIKALASPHTFTITTGHQLSLFTGPLYFIYKILSVIKLSEQMKAKHPEKNFVPVYWMASEDHDFEEINHFHVFGNKYQWDSAQKGAVGEFKLDGIEVIFEQFKEELSIFKRAYLHHQNLSEATFYLVNTLFKAYGLVIIEPNAPSFKAQFSAVIKEELIAKKSFDHVNQTSEKLKSKGYKTQVNPREINLFYLDKGIRERLMFEQNTYKVNNTKLAFSEKEIIDLVDKHPEKFSPNVVLRPLFQECILPNIAYVGGPGELAYWLQLKSNFEAHDVFFPALIFRDSFILLNKTVQKSIANLGMDCADLSSDYNILKAQIIEQDDNEINLKREVEKLSELQDSIISKTKDKSLHPTIEAEIQKQIKGLKNLEGKIRKSEERLHETQLNQLKKLKEKLFPGNAPQERVENLLNFYINDEDIISTLYQSCNPLDYQQKIIYLDA